VPRLDYAAGAMILDGDDVTRLRYRTAEPLLAPETSKERAGVDRHIGVARLERGADNHKPSPWRIVDATA